MDKVLWCGAVVDPSAVVVAYYSKSNFAGEDHHCVKYALQGVKNSYQEEFKSEQEARDALQMLLNQPSKGRKVLSEITSDVKGFIKENRAIIYWLALAFLVDHFFFNGAFKDKLNTLVHKMIGRVEKQIEDAK